MNAIAPIVADTEGVELLALKDNNQCKFPVHSEDRHHLFCGKPSHGSWCAEHAKVVWMADKDYRPRTWASKKLYRPR